MNGRIIPLSLPKWGLLMTEGTLASWRAPVDARLAVGDPVADIESEKIVNELEAHEPGILRRQLIQAGETCPVARTRLCRAMTPITCLTSGSSSP